MTRDELKGTYNDAIEQEHLKDELATVKVMFNAVCRPEKISSKNLEVIPKTVLDDIKNKMIERQRNNSFYGINPRYLYDVSLVKAPEHPNLRCTIKPESTSNKRKDYSSMYSNNRYYNEIKDILQISEISVETSKEYCREHVRIEGYVNREDLINKKKRENMGIPKATGIIRRGKATIVTWADKTKTTIVLEDNQQDMDIFHTFCIAFTKKMLGSTGAILKTIEENDTDTIERKKKEAAEAGRRKAEKVNKMCKELSEKLKFEKAVQEKMLEQRAYDEAIRRIIAREDKKMENMKDGLIEGIECEKVTEE